MRGPVLLRLAVSVLTSAGLFDEEVQLFSNVISNVHKRSLEPTTCTILWRLRYTLVHC
ncbi:hypothetical protein EMIT0P294_100096 [Pseudomonas sp. IT-P294]